jgi:MFS family permease
MTSGEVDSVPQSVPPVPTPGMERSNGFIFSGATLFTFLAAPVIYVGVVQAALCQRLGASADIANLPGATFLLGNFAPFLLSAIVPHRHERLTVVLANSLTSLSSLAIAVCLTLPAANSLLIATIIGQGFIQGFGVSTSLVFMYQCLGRGTSQQARARTLKRTFSAAPFAAVAGSLGTQAVLNHGIPSLAYPYDFASIFFYGAICMAVVAALVSRYNLPPIPDEPRQAVYSYLRDSIAGYARSRYLVRLWIAYALWFSTISVVTNFGLAVRQVLGRDPQELAGVSMALRFGGKALVGYGLGALAIRYGMRAPVVATVALVTIATLWGWFVPGYSYLLAFALMGGGELGGAYFPNYIISSSSPSAGVRNLSLLTLATPAASLGAVFHGTLAEHFGFSASYLFAVITGLIALLLVFHLPVKNQMAAKQ